MLRVILPTKASGHGCRSGSAAFEQVIGPQQKLITIVQDRKFLLACLLSYEACSSRGWNCTLMTRHQSRARHTITGGGTRAR
jgi:hypothetical protein